MVSSLAAIVKVIADAPASLRLVGRLREQVWRFYVDSAGYLELNVLMYVCM